MTTTVLELRTFLIRNGRDGSRFNPYHEKKTGKFASKEGGGGLGLGGLGISGVDPNLPGAHHPGGGMGAGIARTPDAADQAPPLTDPKAAEVALRSKMYVHIDPAVIGSAAEVMAGAGMKPGTYNMSLLRPVGNETMFQGVGLPRGASREYEESGGKSGWPGMPQIDDVDGYEADLISRGVGVERKSVDPMTLKATQSQLDMAKAGGIAKAGNHRVPPGKRVLVSEDGYVIDGHHRYAAAIAAGENIEVVVVKKPMRAALDDAIGSKLNGGAKKFGDK
jgi:hypothetical protein